jgi:hypothetical protein
MKAGGRYHSATKIFKICNLQKKKKKTRAQIQPSLELVKINGAHMLISKESLTKHEQIKSILL